MQTLFESLAFGVPANFTTFGNIFVQVDGLSGGDTVSFVGAMEPTEATYPLKVMSISGTFATISSSATLSGIYAVIGGGGTFLTATHTGTASTPVLTVSASL